MAPLLGGGYNKWVPMMILAFCVISLFNLHGRIARLFGIKGVFYRVSGREPECNEGRMMIERGMHSAFTARASFGRKKERVGCI